MSHGPAGGASDWLGAPRPAVATPEQLAAAAAEEAAQHAVPPPGVLAAAAAAGAAQPQAGGVGGASPAPEAQQFHEDDAIMQWIVLATK